MRLELLAQIILIISFLGLMTLIFCKSSLLNESAMIVVGKKSEKKFLFYLKNSKYFKLEFFEILLQKICSKIRILSLKTENKMADWLKKLRERSQRKKIKSEDNFWEELKKSTNKDKK